MACCEVSAFLKEKQKHSQLGVKEITARAGIARQTWYKLINGDIKEAKLSTILRLSRALQIHPNELLDIYFRNNGFHYNRAA